MFNVSVDIGLGFCGGIVVVFECTTTKRACPSSTELGSEYWKEMAANSVRQDEIRNAEVARSSLCSFFRTIGTLLVRIGGPRRGRWSTPRFMLWSIGAWIIRSVPASATTFDASSTAGAALTSKRGRTESTASPITRIAISKLGESTQTGTPGTESPKSLDTQTPWDTISP